MDPFDEVPERRGEMRYDEKSVDVFLAMFHDFIRKEEIADLTSFADLARLIYFLRALGRLLDYCPKKDQAQKREVLDLTSMNSEEKKRVWDWWVQAQIVDDEPPEEYSEEGFNVMSKILQALTMGTRPLADLDDLKGLIEAASEMGKFLLDGLERNEPELFEHFQEVDSLIRTIPEEELASLEAKWLQILKKVPEAIFQRLPED